MEELKSWMEKHNLHISRLEALMRMVDNDAISMDQIKKIQDDVEHYIECNQDPDFEENEFVYEDLDLDEIGKSFCLEFLLYIIFDETANSLKINFS